MIIVHISYNNSDIQTEQTLSTHLAFSLLNNHINFWKFDMEVKFLHILLILLKKTFLSTEKAGHPVRKCISSSTLSDLHIGQNLDSAGIFLKRPISISNL